MASVAKVNKKLNKAFGGAVHAAVENDYLVLRGSLPAWADVVRAGYMAAQYNPLRTLVNDIECTGEKCAPVRHPVLQDNALEGATPDVLVIGAGITGCAIARELRRYNMSVLLLDKEHDVALHASSRNDGMVHPGLDLKPGTLKDKYNKAGNAMYGEVCRELGVTFVREGQYLCFNRRGYLPLLYLTLLYWKYRGIPAKVVHRKALGQVGAGLHPDIRCALYFPTTGNVCPYNLTIAYAENAVQNGAQLSLDTAVLGMETQDGRIEKVHTNRGTVYPRVVINAAGTFADDIAGLAGDRFYSIHPRRGTNSILDSKFTPATLYHNASVMGARSAAKGSHSKGGGSVMTVERNLLLGPDAVETCQKEDFATYPTSIDNVLEKQRQTSPLMHKGQIITYFTGVRAPTYEEDFVVCRGRRVTNLVHAAGIQSPGLTAAPALALDVAALAAEALAEITQQPVEKNPQFDPVRVPIPQAAKLPDAARAALIAQDPDFGEIVCRCEQVSRGEVLGALRRAVPCDTVDGVKRRVRPGMGRCQGGFCGPLVAQIIAEEKGLPLSKVLKTGGDGNLLYGPVKSGAGAAAPHKGGGSDAG